MNKYFYILLCTLVLFSSCQQNSNVSPSATNNFLEFDANGTTVRYELTTPAHHISISQSWSGGTSSNLVNSGYVGAYYGDTASMNISFSTTKSSLTLSDYQSLVGQKIPLGICTTANCLQAYIVRTFNSSIQIYKSESSANNLPNDYLKITQVSFHSNDPRHGNLYKIQGEFSGTLEEDDGTTQMVNNGTFQLLFPEY